MSGLLGDLRFAVRMLLKNRGFTVVAILTLALGIGANTAIFTVLNAVVLRPLPYPEPERLVHIWETSLSQGGRGRGPSSVPNLRDWREQNEVFEAIGGYHPGDVILTGAGEPVRVPGTRVEPEMFPAVRGKPLLGRVLLPGENQPGKDRVAVLSYGLWQERYAGDPNVLGRTIGIDGALHTVVGVMPPEFQLPPRAPSELWTPLTFTRREEESRGSYWVNVMARLKPGVSLPQAQANMDTIARRLEQQYPAAQEKHGVWVYPLHAVVVGRDAAVLLVLLWSVGLVLLIACANVTHMSLARSTARRREFAVRLALGAGRLRLARLLLGESLVLALAGGALGLLASIWCLDLLMSLPDSPLLPGEPLVVDTTVLVFCAAISVVAALASGFAPALATGVKNLQNALKEGGPAGSVAPGRRRLRNVWVAGEVAVALAVLIAASLMVESLRRLASVDFGFQPENVLTLRLHLPPHKYSDPEKRAAFWDQSQEALRSVPGVQSAGMISRLPVEGWGTNGPFSVEGRPQLPPGQQPFAEYRIVSPGYFEALRIPLVAGRYPDRRDRAGSPRTVIINQRAVELYWPGENPVGQRISTGFGSGDEWLTIVGVVGDVKNRGLYLRPQSEIYVPLGQRDYPAMSLVVRSKVEPANLTSDVRRAVWAIDRDLPIFRVKTMEQIISDSISGTRFLAMLLSAFGALALALAVIGIYGVMSYSASQRTHEIGLRMALGAQRHEVLALMLKRGFRQVAWGVGLGITAAVGMSGVLRRFVFGLAPVDALTYAMASAVVAAAALAACYLSARRAASVDPAVALRCE